MSQPKKAFNEVRAILGKLDRSREELRQQPPTSQNQPGLGTSQTIGTGVGPAPAPTPQPVRPGFKPATPNATPAQTTPTPPSPGSKYGRAQPIRPASSDNALGRWKAPGQ